MGCFFNFLINRVSFIWWLSCVMLRLYRYSYADYSSIDWGIWIPIKEFLHYNARTELLSIERIKAPNTFPAVNHVILDNKDIILIANLKIVWFQNQWTREDNPRVHIVRYSTTSSICWHCKLIIEREWLMNCNIIGMHSIESIKSS